MKTSFKVLLPVLLVILVVAATGDKPAGRIATIDLRHLFDKYYRHEQVMKLVDQEQADIEKKLKSMQDEGQKLLDERNKIGRDMSDPMITSQEKDALRKKLDAKGQEIEAKKNEIQTYRDHAVEQLDLENKRVNEQIIKEIRAAVEAKAKSAGYSQVIDSSALVYDNKENDITEEILKQINAAAPTTPLTDPLKTNNIPDRK